MSKKKLPIPDFKSIEEMANFWDSHDTEDYQWEEVKDIKFSKNLKSVYVGGAKPPKSIIVQMRLDKETISAMERVARQKGVGTSTAARILIRERLSEMKIISYCLSNAISINLSLSGESPCSSANYSK